MWDGEGCGYQLLGLNGHRTLLDVDVVKLPFR